MTKEEMSKILNLIDCYVSVDNEKGILYEKYNQWK